MTIKHKKNILSRTELNINQGLILEIKKIVGIEFCYEGSFLFINATILAKEKQKLLWLHINNVIDMNDRTIYSKGELNLIIEHLWRDSFKEGLVHMKPHHNFKFSSYQKLDSLSGNKYYDDIGSLQSPWIKSKLL